MSDLKLFKITNTIEELPASTVNIEKELQTLIENNMEKFFGVRFLQTEYTTTNGGRIDSLGIDENNCPVIFEYKRASNENVINQGLFYLDWLLDHKANFELFVLKKFGQKTSDNIDWTMPRLICVAGDFTKYDEYAVKQIPRNIDLIRYRLYGNELILFELVNSNISKPLKDTADSSSTKKTADKNFDEQLQTAEPNIRNLYFSIRDYILALGDDITENQLKLYVAFKKIKNIICIEVRVKSIMLYLRLNPEEIKDKDNFIRDVRKVGHWGTGDVEITIKSNEDFQKAKEYIDRCYQIN